MVGGEYQLPEPMTETWCFFVGAIVCWMSILVSCGRNDTEMLELDLYKKYGVRNS
jgi:hypothetical protein